MTDHPNKMYWMGEDVEGLPREKLIEIIRHLADDLERQRRTTKSIIDINRLAREYRARGAYT